MHHAAATTGMTAVPPTAREPRFEELYDAYFAELTVQLFAYFGDRQEAQDVVQEAFCRALAVQLGRPDTFLVRISCAGPGGSVTLIAQASGRDDPHPATAQCATTADEVAAGVGETTIEIGDSDDIEFELVRNGTAQWGSGGIWPIVATTVTLL